MNKEIFYMHPKSASSSKIEFHQTILMQDSLWHTLKGFGSKFALVVDENVKTHYGEFFLRALELARLDATLFTFPAGEQSKTRETKSFLEDQMHDHYFGRDTCLIAIGGGVTLDLGGFLAATYCRGIPLISIPTTLLAMVDAAIGGKNGVNTSHGKNRIGTTYQAKKIIIDTTLLKTLPKQELKNGFVEMIKHGLVASSLHVDFLENHVCELLAMESQLLEKAILDSCRIKMAIVKEDEQENGQRRILNFGHTVAHALERLTNYSLSHGEAVAIGLIAESHLSMQFGTLDRKSFERIYRLLLNYGLPLKLPLKLTPEGIRQAMLLDKKSVNSEPRFVLLEKIGQAKSFHSQYCTPVKTDLLYRSLDWMLDDLCCR